MNKKVLSLVLIVAMCATILTGCGKKPDEEFKALFTEISEIKSGAASIDMTMTISGDVVMPEEEVVDPDDESLSLDFDDAELFEDMLDKDGNLNMDIGLDVKFNDDKQSEIKIEVLDEDMKFFVDDKDVYMDIGGLFDILGKIAGQEISFLQAFFGNYEYLKTTSDEEMKEIFPENKSFNKYISAETVTEKDGAYVLALDNDYIEDSLTEENLESLNIEEVKDSDGSITLSKNKDGSFNVAVEMNIENKMIIDITATLAEGDPDIKIPSGDKVLDTDDEGSFDLGFGEDYTDEDFYFDEDDFDIDIDYDDSFDDDYSVDWTEDFEDIELNYDFDVYSGEFDFILQNDNKKGAEVKQASKDINDKLEVLLDTSNVLYSTSNYNDAEYNSYSTYYNADFGNFEEDISVYISDGYVSYDLAYTMYEKDMENSLDDILERIKEFSGVEVPKSKVMEWVSTLKSQYKEDYFSMRVYGDIGDNYDTFCLTLWDGEEVEISIERNS